MRQHRLALCAEHYQEWLPQQTERFIKKYEMFTRYERLLLAVSGGKDSLALWDVLWQLGYNVDGLYINLGIDGALDYSDQSQQYAQQFADKRGLKLINVNVREQTSESIPEIAQRTRRGQDKTCSICGLVKRHIFNQSARDGNYDAVITAHNLDDEAAVLLSNSLDWSLGAPGARAAAAAGRRGLRTQSQALLPFLRARNGRVRFTGRYRLHSGRMSLLHRQQTIILQARPQPLGGPYARHQTAFLFELSDRPRRRRFPPPPGKPSGVGRAALPEMRPAHHHRHNLRLLPIV